MGITHVTAQIRDLARAGNPFEAEFLVDTGSLHCLAPASRLREAGVTPEGKQMYELANGEPIEYDYGFARVSFLGDETVAHVIFGPEDAEPLLGAVALENTGVVVDPANQTLKRLPAVPLKGTRQADVLKRKVVVLDTFFGPLPEEELRLWVVVG